MSNTNVSIYYCGGTGVNACRRIASQIPAATHFAIDTSKANNKNQQVGIANLFLFDDMDGSGKQRSLNYSAISAKADEILYKFPTDKVAIVVHSASGGSGSVIGPVLYNKLLSEGKIVLAVVVGSTDSATEVNNTVKTISSYKAISNQNDKPAIVFYQEVNAEHSRAAVDSMVDLMISLFVMYFSEHIDELDTSDMKNFMQFQNVTNFKPSIARLEVHKNTVVMGKGEIPVACATLTDVSSSYTLPFPIQYQTVGIVKDVKLFDSINGLPIHLVITKGSLEKVESDLTEIQHRHDAFLKSVKDVTHDVVANNSDGLVL